MGQVGIGKMDANDLEHQMTQQMNKYKFMNGYVAQWPNKATSPGDVYAQKISWLPRDPNVEDCGDQFMGEYLYSFIPRMCQPIANRTQSGFLFRHDTRVGPIIEISFKPNEKPKYKEMLLPTSIN